MAATAEAYLHPGSKAGEAAITRSQEGAVRVSSEEIAASTKRFILPASKQFMRQYSSIYFARLMQMRASIASVVAAIVAKEQRKGQFARCCESPFVYLDCRAGFPCSKSVRLSPHSNSHGISPTPTAPQSRSAGSLWRRRRGRR